MPNYKLVLCFLLVLSGFVSAAAAQCPCDRTPQDNGSVYIRCAPILQATGEMGLLEVGLSSMADVRYLHANLTFEGEATELAGMLTLHAANGTKVNGVLLERDMVPVDGKTVAYALYFLQDPFETLKGTTVSQVAFSLQDSENMGQIREWPVNYSNPDLTEHLGCLEE